MKVRTAAVAARAALLAVIAMVGCRQIVGIEDQPPGAGDAGAQACAPLNVGNASCDACMASACCAEEQQCTHADSGACASLVQCLGQCDPKDPACASACRTQSGVDEEAAALRSCQATRCASACGITCGGYIYASSTCAACANSACCAVARTCQGDPECARLAACEQSCAPADDGCLSVCELAYPTAVNEERAFGQCTSDHCGASCIAPQWTCLETPTPPPTTPPAVQATYTFFDYVSETPVAGLELRACALMDSACSLGPPPIPTNEFGVATLQLPAGFDGYAEVNGAGVGYFSFLMFLPPLSSDFSAPPLAVATTSEIAMLIGNWQQSQLGLVMALPRDCFGAPAGGVKLGIAPSAGTTPFYVLDKIISVTATQTDDQGFVVGGFFNVATNAAIQVSATVAANALQYPPATIFTRPGSYSVVVMYPSPQ